MRVKYLGFLLILIILSSFVFGQTSDIMNVESATLNVKIRSDMEIVSTSPSYTISYLETKTTFYPENTRRQSVDSFSTTPNDYTTVDDMMVFRWDEPSQSDYYYEINSDVTTQGDYIKIKKKIPYPREDNMYPEYVLPTDHIDSDNPDIEELAKTLMQGKDDYYEVVLTIGAWVHNNIHYNLSTLTADVSQKASWVLDTREGVCDEMTSLFIALLRSVNIPARYISGVAYTNSDLFDYDFGPHGWAEVYFPGYGWVPFDATYGEYGYVDSSHVSLKKSTDSGESSTFYGWKGRNVDVKASQMAIETNIISLGESVDHLFEINIKPIKTKVGFGSHNLIEATITNTKNYYVPTVFYLSRVQNMDIITNPSQLILFKPEETKTIYWTIKVSENLDPRFTYTYPFTIYTPRRNESSQSSFKVMDDYTIYPLDSIISLKDQKEEESETDNDNSKISFYCEAARDIFFEDEVPRIDCTLQNGAQVKLNDVNICAYEICELIDINPLSSKEVKLNIPQDTYGSKELFINAKSSDITKSDQVEFIYKKYPNVDIKDIDYPSEIEYNEKFQFKFVLAGENNPQDLIVNMNVNKMSKTWRFEQITVDREFILNLNSKDLYPKDNNISIIVLYSDENDNNYKLMKSNKIDLTNLSLVRKIILYLKMFVEENFN